MLLYLINYYNWLYKNTFITKENFFIFNVIKNKLYNIILNN